MNLMAAVLLVAAAADPYLWLEGVDAPRAMDWVRAENAKTLAVLEKDPRHRKLYEEALAIAENKDRLPIPVFAGGGLYNFWRDADHVRGIWRRTSIEQYAKPRPEWHTVLDLDAVSAAEKANWVWHGADCLRPDERRCLITLSDGGEDASTVREFDTQKEAFVDRGFALPKSKQSVGWLDADRLIVARDFGPGTMTSSGYPFVVKTIARGQPLEGAKEIFRGAQTDVGIELATFDSGDDHIAIISRNVTFFESEQHLVTTAGVKKLGLPAKVQVQDFLAGKLLVQLNEAWQDFTAGSLVAVDLAAAVQDPAHLKATLVYAPGPKESIGEVAAMKTELIVGSSDNVRGRVSIFSPQPDGSWKRTPLPAPDMSSVNVVAADLRADRAFVQVRSFLVPSTLLFFENGALTQVKSLPRLFDASKHVVEQHEATSRDGTKIPYFIVHPKAMKLDGKNPTILNAYGGFQVSETPFYSGTLGKLWLENGGTYVLANIRGGGEFGPAWHEAGLKTNRQRIYDDFVAVARDLIDRRITSPRHLGIEGGSNGGLLMGVMFTQHPELWNAVDMQVPLLDMIRYEQIAAGASWVGEYGSVSNPAEREFLEKISPYANLKAGTKYPLPLVWTTTKDDRVGPQHARKFAARLSELKIPYLYYEVIEGGHGSGANLKEQAKTSALEMTYFLRQLR